MTESEFLHLFDRDCDWQKVINKIINIPVQGGKKTIKKQKTNKWYIIFFHLLKCGYKN